MSLVKGTNPQTIQIAKIVRSRELASFVQAILVPEHMSYTIVWVSGIGGIGKSVLLEQFREKTCETGFKDYCLMALVDERQSTPVSIMATFAEQLRRAGHPLTKFEKELVSCKEDEQALLAKIPDTAGALVGIIPMFGKLLQILSTPIIELIIFLSANRLKKRLKNNKRSEEPLGTLTQAFIEELNRITMTRVTSRQVTQCWRVILFFDTFEKLAPGTVPWLLNYFLEAGVSNNLALVVAGRDPYDYSIDNAPKLWSKYRDRILSISLGSFTREETYDYLHRKGVIERNALDNIWQLSRGFPFYLSSYMNPKIHSTRAVVDNFLHLLPKEEFVKRRLAVCAALLSRPFHQDDVYALKDILGPEQDWPDLYRWLIRQDFVLTMDDGRYSYDELVQEFFCRDLYQTSPSEYEKTCRVLEKYYREQLVKIRQDKNKQVYDSPQWLELVLAQATQLFLMPDKTSHAEAIELVLKFYTAEWQTSLETSMKLSLFSLKMSVAQGRFAIQPYTYTAQTKEIELFLAKLSQKHPNSEINANIQAALKTLRQRLAQSKYVRSRNQ